VRALQRCCSPSYSRGDEEGEEGGTERGRGSREGMREIKKIGGGKQACVVALARGGGVEGVEKLPAHIPFPPSLPSSSFPPCLPCQK